MIRSSYWSNSTLAQKLRAFFGVVKPKSASIKEWKAWREEYKIYHPILYFITEELLSKFQNILNYPKDKIYELHCALNARFKDRYFGMTSTLDKWRYHEIDDRILFCNFETLVEFVESENAISRVRWSDDNKDYGHRWYHETPIISLFAPDWRSKEAGEAALQWACNLKINDNHLGHCEVLIKEAEKDGSYGQFTPQAVLYKEIADLYYWWTQRRPNRLDPMEQSGYNKYTENDSEDIFPEVKDKDGFNKAIIEMDRIETMYHDEDTEMLCRLMKVRQGLWT